MGKGACIYLLVINNQKKIQEMKKKGKSKFEMKEELLKSLVDSDNYKNDDLMAKP